MAIYVGDPFQRLGSVAYYSPTIPRGGLAVALLLNIFAISATSFTVTIEHKNIEDLSWTALAAATYNTTGLQNALTGSSVKEQVRIKYVVNGANDTDAVYCNTLAPIWQPYP